MNDKWHTRFMSLASEIATWSKDPSTQVGAVIVRPDKTICSTGFNGFPQGTDDNEVLYSDRDTKLDRVIHAEMNALLFAPESVVGYTLYTTTKPCARCAAHIVQSKIKTVVYPLHDIPERWAESMERTNQLFVESGVEQVMLI